MQILKVNDEELIRETQTFIDSMYAIDDDFLLNTPGKQIGTCINYRDLKEMRESFISELVLTVTDYVYSRSKQNSLFIEFSSKRSPAAANHKLVEHSKSKFRRPKKLRDPSSQDEESKTSLLQGQFSELLLFNLLKYYFKAIPFCRKMPITTNTKLERNGADAIHLAAENGTYKLFIGEAKTYNRKNGSLKDALEDSINDVIYKHYENIDNELNLYTYDFLPDEYKELAKDFTEGRLDNFEIHLVCIVTYNLKNNPEGMNRQEKLANIINDIRNQTKRAQSWKIFRDIPKELRPRLNYIIFPVNKMNDLIEKFEKKIGVEDA
ncbi:HamA C-terminal domain-containing protein [Gracilibacillus sp. HCP3S3_G5_1]|uniref:HamA C-terminal domain-containing protein n=1 Tax=unclassified Gracilibacillus TaxID=2625209 RepID=UPI003F897400